MQREDAEWSLCELWVVTSLATTIPPLIGTPRNKFIIFREK